MNSLVSWQLMLLLCATSFRETLEKVAPMETPGPAGMHCLGRGWEGARELLENEGYRIFQSEASLLMPAARTPGPPGPGPGQAQAPGSAPTGSPRGTSLCPPPGNPAGPQHPGLRAPQRCLMPAPRGAVPGRGDLPTYNWNVFGLRYGRRRATTPGLRG
ncbi:unnamed protein product [Nyctereutes procyonoides]|uniref:(raccoon dog) hypothetical protein n=1 Tax=Nyctereutes procyonoides TaxID=34880 RepID=A0A811Z046_NYCPR|nr:unnamed protein product [Nyctereutes procyonoides]